MNIDVPDLVLERYRLGELPPADAARVERLLSADAALRQRLEALERSDEEIARQYPARWLAGQIRARRPSRERGRSRWPLPLGIAAAAIVLVFAMPRAWPGQPRNGDTSATAGDRIKGLEPALTVYRRTASGSETLADGSIARTGDLLRVGYIAAGRGYGVILSIDGRGVVTRHLPAEGDRAAALGRGGATLLDRAYELDDAPGWERFYFITGDTPFAVAPIVDAAKTAAAAGAGRIPSSLPLARELSQSVFSLQKEVKP
jgi:hypothetical protein